MQPLIVGPAVLTRAAPMNGQSTVFDYHLGNFSGFLTEKR